MLALAFIEFLLGTAGAQIIKGIATAEYIAKSPYCVVGNICTDVLTYSFRTMYNGDSKLSSFLRSMFNDIVPNNNF
jgi:hypothetical protein